MPRVPVVNQIENSGPSDQYRRTTADANALSAGARGLSRAGQAVAEVGGDFMAAQDAVNQRNWAVERAQATDQYNREARDLYQAEVDSGSNFAKPDALSSYNMKLKELRTKYLSQHGGDGDSRARLETMLIGDEGRWSGSALTTSRQSQAALVNTQFGETVAKLSQDVLRDPSLLEDRLEQMETALSNYDATTTPEQRHAMYLNGVAVIAGGAIEQQITFGNLEGARKIYTELGMTIPESQRLKINQKLMALEGAQARKEADKAATYQRLKEAGVDVTDPKVALAIETGITLPADKITLSDRVAEWEKASGRKAPQDVIDRLAEIQEAYDPSTAGGPGGRPTGFFGNSAQGRAQEYLGANAARFAAGDMTQAEESMYWTAAAIASSFDPITKQSGQISPQVREAFAKRGYDIRHSLSGLNIPELPQTPTLPTAPAQDQGQGLDIPRVTPPQAGFQGSDQGALAPVNEGNQDAYAAPGSEADQPAGLSLDTAVQDSRKYEEAGGLLSPQASLPKETVFQMADLITGPESSVRAAGARVPLVGGLVEDSRVTQARSYLEFLIKDMVRVFQNNPRYAEGERTDIKADLKMEGSFWDRPERYRDNLIGIDRAMEERLQNALETVRTRAVGSLEYTQALNVVNSVSKFRKAIGVPPVMTSPEEVKQKLRPGDMYRRSDGKGGWLIREYKG